MSRIRGFVLAIRRGSPEDADDLVQDLFLALVRRGALERMTAAAQDAEHLRGMIFKAAKRFVIDDFRRRQAAKRAGWEFRLPIDEGAELPSSDRWAEPDAVLAYRELAAVVAGCEEVVASEYAARGQGELPASFERVLEHGSRHAELAEHAQLTPGAFRTALSRYRRRLRTLVNASLAEAA